MKQLWEFGYAIRSLQARVKYGALSRAPLRFSRLEWKFDEAECHWIARKADPWDANLPPDIRDHHASLQALKDAMVIREILFSVLPDIQKATLRGYRISASAPPELIVTGRVTRERETGTEVASIAMRAKLLGFQFLMEDGVLENLQGGKRFLEVAAYE
jgi:hypothetical protein